MATHITKRFSTIETILGLMRYRDIMFRVIEAADSHRGNAIPETEYLRFVAEYQNGQSKELVSEIALLFDCENLLQAKVLNDKKSAGGVTKLWFNTSIIDVFRLCKISLYRPLNRISLNASMTPIWAIVKDIEDQRISMTPGTEEYDDWTGEVCHRTTELLGKISANTSKLERVGEMFKKELHQEANEGSLEVTKVKFQEATRLYRREIIPLSDFLDKNTRYEQGDGIIITLETLQAFFRSFGDLETQGLMVRYQLQYLEMYKPIKSVADNVSVYLRKTKAAILEHNAIESAFTVLRQAYENTLSGDKRNKYINVGDLAALGSCHPIKSISRPPSFRVEKTPAFLNNVFNELASRNSTLHDSVDKTFLFEENISRESANKLKHSIKLSKWVEAYEWPLETDYLKTAMEALQSDWPAFTLPDLLEIGSKLHTCDRYQVVLTNEFNTIEDDNFKLRYRTRYLIPNPKKREGCLTMDPLQNTFSQVNAALSQSIYQDFNSGGVINKKEYLESLANFKESAKYRDMIVNQSHYQQLYFHLGFLLIHDDEGEYFYLKNANNDEAEDTFDETSLKLMAILTILARLADKRGQSYRTLGVPVQGIVNGDLDALNEDSEALSFLKSLKIKDAADAIVWLKKRGFAFRVNKARSILSHGAIGMIDAIIERQKRLNIEVPFEG